MQTRPTLFTMAMPQENVPEYIGVKEEFKGMVISDGGSLGERDVNIKKGKN